VRGLAGLKGAERLRRCLAVESAQQRGNTPSWSWHRPSLIESSLLGIPEERRRDFGPIISWSTNCVGSAGVNPNLSGGVGTSAWGVRPLVA
jgi:hypothetical protein